MRYLALFALLTICVVPVHAAEMLPVPLSTAGVTDAAPTIDGSLDDACWQSAAVLGGFVKLDGSALATPETEARVCWDAERLYVGVRCAEPNVKAIKAQMTERDDAVWRDDCVELFIDTNHDRSSYYHFAVNAIGTVWDEERPGSADWNADVQAAGARGEDEWTAEISIALADLGGAQPGDLWGFNIGRERYA
ncbi:MAG: carbohydrate-binding family 9-like protein, partial [Armatimonadota bacterium]